MRVASLLQPLLLLIATPISCEAFVPAVPTRSSSRNLSENHHHPSSTALQLAADNKFGVLQRIESIKCLVVGGLAGSLALAPVALVHDVFFLAPHVTTSGLAQWEFDNDMASLVSALFAIVYRYCIRQDENEQLKQGVVGAFVLTRTLSRIVVPPYCTAIVLNCGSPLGYLDWSMIQQGLVNGVESAVMFGATAAAMEWAMSKGYISKFPG